MFPECGKLYRANKLQEKKLGEGNLWIKTQTDQVQCVDYV